MFQQREDQQEGKRVCVSGRKCKLGAVVGVGSCKCPTKMLTFDSNWELEDLVFQPGAPPAYIQRSVKSVSLWEIFLTFLVFRDPLSLSSSF